MIDVFYMMLLALPMACFGYFLGLAHAGRFKKRSMKIPKVYGLWNDFDCGPKFNCRCVAIPPQKYPDDSVIERNERMGMDFSDLIAETNKDPSE